LDRFGRLVETLWGINFFSSTVVQTQYGRNRFGGVVWRYDQAAHALGTAVGNQQDNYYWYDGLYRPGQHQRGTLDTYHTGITSPQQNEVFGYDQMGNWLAYQTSDFSPPQTRDFNKLNEITRITNPGTPVNPVYDPVGNMTTMPAPDNWSTADTLKWDAWNRLVEVKQGNSLVAGYSYDALSRRIVTTTVVSGTTNYRHFYYDTGGRVIEERTGATAGGFSAEYVWGVRGNSDLIRRRTGTTAVWLFSLNDGANVIALAQRNDGTGSTSVVERYSYDTYGTVRFLDPGFTALSPNTSAFGWNYLWKSTFRNEETSLYYSRTFYSTTLGRALNDNGPVSNEFSYDDGYYVLAGDKCCPKEGSPKYEPIAGEGTVVPQNDPAIKDINMTPKVVPNGRRVGFEMSAEFDNKSPCRCSCCWVKQFIDWTDGATMPQHKGFVNQLLRLQAKVKQDTPAGKTPELPQELPHPTEDIQNRPPFRHYGDRNSAPSSGSSGANTLPKDRYVDPKTKQPKQADGCRYEGSDYPTSTETKGKWNFKLEIWDTCAKPPAPVPGFTANLTINWS
jgi:YD repeat-containing protein